MTDLYYDQYDYTIDDDPYPVLKRMRDEAPVWYNQQYNFWLLSRFEDVSNASKNHETFSSAWGTMLEIMTENPGESTAIINNDPPYHSEMRRLVAARFSPRNVATLENQIRAIVVGYLERLEGKPSFDFVQDFCRWIPMEVVSVLLGVPEADRKQINTWGDQVLHRDEGQTEESGMARIAREGLTEYVAKAMYERRAQPQDDLMSLIANGQIRQDDGSMRPINDQEAIEYMFLLAAAGNETVARLLGNACYYLACFPDLRQQLRDEPNIMPQAIEELLRFDPPSPVQFRRTIKPITLHGVTIPAGSNVALSTAGAARDERQYQNPDVLDFKRSERNVSLGEGVHACLGAHVARMEIRIALEEFLKRFPDWTVDEAGLKRVRTSTVRGYSHVPIRF